MGQKGTENSTKLATQQSSAKNPKTQPGMKRNAGK
ncbi:hypothetical protein LCGC14_1920360 [marine sediment metagenome]|uniref:Uncharacterized protein n=1 Tax=marine sediment metagenome TaxID=412755 RepID=A0A0F9INS3_9ZZZZ